MNRSKHIYGPSAIAPLFSWETMKTNAAAFFAIERALTKLQASAAKYNKQRARSMDERLTIKRSLIKDILPHCQRSGLRTSAGFITEFSQDLADQDFPMKAPEIMAKLDSIKTIISAEINQRVMLQIPLSHEGYYTQAEPLFGQSVANAFPSAAYDISEAGKCLALERGTACVFHLMRAMEVCLRALAASMDIKPHNPNWGDILQKLAPPSNKDPFTLEAHSMLMSCKNAWRNPTMHMEKMFTPEDALAIFEAVKGFMKHLAKSITES